MGADAVIDLDATTPDERLAAGAATLTGGLGADVVVEAAGSARAFEEGVRLARNGGAYVIAGHYTNVGDSTINAHEHINRKHLDIRGCWGSEVGHFLRALDALERHADVPVGARSARGPSACVQINEALEAAGRAQDPESARRSVAWTPEAAGDCHATNPHSRHARAGHRTARPRSAR